MNNVVDIIRERLARLNFRRLAEMQGRRGVCDVAFENAIASRLLVRCAERFEPGDYHALATMLAAGDFDRAVLVYCEREGSVLCDEIETWHIDDLDQLAASLIDGRRPT